MSYNMSTPSLIAVVIQLSNANGKVPVRGDIIQYVYGLSTPESA